ncbi:MAG: sulfite exporter TauE/SafE family protein [Candidatus Accumulibacter sp.]|jgi:uncharacterized membrane protein YfcA|nr:sulfite exporter TauE/SafE family protein [Accumulibacter sp.]
MTDPSLFPDLILFIAGAVVAAFVQGLSGFAFGLTAMSFWVWGISPQFAAVMVVFGSIVGQVTALLSIRQPFFPKAILPYLAGGLAGIPLGVFVLPLLNAEIFKLGFGVFLVFWCVAMLLSPRIPPVKNTGVLSDMLIGAVGGFMGGIGGFTGVVPTLWCTLRKLENNIQRTIVQNFNLSALSITLIVYATRGMLTRQILSFMPLVVVAVLLPSILGARIYLSLNQRAFRRVVLILLCLSGLAMILAAALKLMA